MVEQKVAQKAAHLAEYSVASKAEYSVALMVG
jgi:hypothetical protein